MYNIVTCILGRIHKYSNILHDKREIYANNFIQKTEWKAGQFLSPVDERYNYFAFRNIIIFVNHTRVTFVFAVDVWKCPKRILRIFTTEDVFAKRCLEMSKTNTANIRERTPCYAGSLPLIS